MNQSAMNTGNHQSSHAHESTPLIRLTAGRGTAGQKVWTLRHAATLVGAKRPANIVLHSPGIETAHFVILNTGRQILIRDLYTAEGTFVNDQPLRGVRCLHSGDIIRVVDTPLEVEVEGLPAGPKVGTEKALGFGHSWGACIDEDHLAWRLDAPVMVIGSHVEVPICLDHEKLSPRHAVLFPVEGKVGVFDVGSTHGVWLNGERVTFAMVNERDRLLIGPYTIRIMHIQPHDVFPPWDVQTGERVVSRPPSSPFAKVQAGAEPSADGAIGSTNWERLAGEATKRDPRFAEAFVVPDAPHDPQACDAEPSEEPLAEDAAKMLEQLRLREAVIEKREAELRDRERLLLQRWTKLLSTRCRQCGTPVKIHG